MIDRNTGILGALATGVAILLQHSFMGPPITPLSAILLLALGLWLATFTRPSLLTSRRIRVLYSLATLVQAVHFIEEYAMGFHRDFPALFGYHWTSAQYLTFNLVALAVFVAAVPGLFLQSRLSLLAVWILALVGVSNGLAHTALSVVRGAYFPGSFSAPVHLLLGCALLYQLWASDRV